MRKLQRLINFRKISRGIDGKIADVCSDLIDNHKGWRQATPGTEVAGDGAANGTAVCTLAITAAKKFVCTHVSAATNLAAMLKIGTGALGAMTDIYPVDLYNSLSFTAITEAMPIFHYDNSAGAAVNLIMYAPLTAMAVATNNDVNHKFYGFIGGVEY